MRNTVAVIFSFYLILIFAGCSEVTEEQMWFKGNTHAHTLMGDGDTSPSEVTEWYHSHGYNFLILSEHNHFINPDTVKMPENLRADFILIPGEEITGHKTIHTTAMNIPRLVDWKFNHEHKSEIIQNHVDVTIEAGGQNILNHPNFKWAVSTEDILPVNGLYMFELFNGHPWVRNHGNKNHISTEEMWDVLLTKGMLIYGVSSDDAHQFQVMADTASNSGRGWVMVNAEALNPNAITHAMQHGNFYSSNGVILKEYNHDNSVYKIEVDKAQTLKEIAKPELSGKKVEAGKEGFTIQFIGSNGQVISSFEGESAEFNIETGYPYIRAKAIYRRNINDNAAEEFYAWGQPAFTDGRVNFDYKPSDK